MLISPPSSSYHPHLPPTTPTPSSTRQDALALCVSTLVACVVPTPSFSPSNFANLADGLLLRSLLRDAGFPCLTSSSKESQSGQSSASSEAEESLTTRASRSDAAVLLQIRDQVEHVLRHARGELVPVDEVVLARRGSPSELARIVELVLVCCCVHGTKREEHINAILSLTVQVQAEIMDVIHFHVGANEEDEENEEDNEQHPSLGQSSPSPLQPSPSPLAAKFRRLTRDMSPATFALSSLSPTLGSPLSKVHEGSKGGGRRRDSMDSLMSDSSSKEHNKNSSPAAVEAVQASTSTTNMKNLLRHNATSNAHVVETEPQRRLLRELQRENSALKEENVHNASVNVRQTRQIQELRAQLDQRTKEAHRTAQSFESRANARRAELEDQLYEQNQQVKNLEVRCRRQEDSEKQVRRLNEEVSMLRESNQACEKLRSQVERAKRRLELLPVLKKELADSRRETTDAIERSTQYHEELKKAQRELPRLKERVQECETKEAETDVANVRMATLLEAKEAEIAELRAHRASISATAQRWLGTQTNTTSSSSSTCSSTGGGGDSFLTSSSSSTTSSSSTDKDISMEGIPNSLVEFMAHVACASPPSTFAVSSSSIGSPSTPQAARDLLNQWVGASGGSSDGSASPGSLAGTPRRVMNTTASPSMIGAMTPGTPSSMLLSSSRNNHRKTPASSSMTISSMLQQEAHASKLALRLSRLEQQNHALVEKTNQEGEDARQEMAKLAKDLREKTTNLQAAERKVVEMSAKTTKLARELQDTKATVQRVKLTYQNTKTKTKEETEALERHVTETRSSLRQREEELERSREMLASAKTDHRAAMSELRSEYDALETSHRATINSLHVAEETETHRREQTEYALRKSQDEIKRLRDDKRERESKSERFRREGEEETRRMTTEMIAVREELTMCLQQADSSRTDLERQIREKDREISTMEEDLRDMKRTAEDRQEREKNEKIDVERDMNVFRKQKKNVEEELRTLRKTMQQDKARHLEHVDTLRKQQETACQALEEEITRLGQALNETRLENENDTKRLGEERAKIVQLASANACHVRSEEQLREDLEEMRVYVASETAAGERWSALVQEANRAKFQASAEVDALRRQLSQEKSKRRDEEVKISEEKEAVVRDYENMKNRHKMSVEDFRNANSKIEKLTEHLQNVTREKDSCVEETRRAQAEAEEAQRTSSLLEGTLSRLRTSLEEHTGENDFSKTQLRILQTKVEEAEMKVEASKQRILELEKERTNAVCSIKREQQQAKVEEASLRASFAASMERVLKEQEQEKQQLTGQSDAVEAALASIEIMENEICQKKIELEETTKEITRMKRAVSIADTAAAAMARGREEACVRVDALRKELLEVKKDHESKAGNDKKLALENAMTEISKKVETLKSQLMKSQSKECVCEPCSKCTVGCMNTGTQTMESEKSFILLGGENIFPNKTATATSTSIATANEEKSNGSMIMTVAMKDLVLQLQQREFVIEKQAVWRKKHMEREMELAEKLHHARTERKSLLARVRNVEAVEAVETVTVKTSVMVEEGETQTPMEWLSEKMGQNTDAVAITVTEVGMQTELEIVSTISFSSSEVSVQTDAETKDTKMDIFEDVEQIHMMSIEMTETTTLVSIPSTTITSSASTTITSSASVDGGDEAAVLRHALKKLQEELSDVRISYDTHKGSEVDIGMQSTTARASGVSVCSASKLVEGNSSNNRRILGELTN